MTQETTKYIVPFKTEWRSDGGLRIYAIGPTGLYISSQSTYAAAEYFQNFAVFVLAEQLRESNPTGGVSMEYPDWEIVAEKGDGEIRFEAISAAEMEQEHEPQSSAGSMEGDFPPKAGEDPEIAEIELQVHKRKIGDKNICVITDRGEEDPALEEIIRRLEVVQ